MKPAAWGAAPPVAGKVDVVIVGAGHSGLAMSHCLAVRGIDHVVLERGEVANAWRHERWDSLRLLTPNWLTRLPGMAYDGDDPDGFMGRVEVAAFIDRYARANAAPVRAGTTVTAVTQDGAGYRVDTDRGRWRCRAVVVASGAFSRPCVPRLAAALPAGVAQLTPHQYRNPGQVEEGGVLVVGASGEGGIDVTTKAFTLSQSPVSLLGGKGTSLVIHANPDDEKTDPTGNSGGRIACGVIAK